MQPAGPVCHPELSKPHCGPEWGETKPGKECGMSRAASRDNGNLLKASKRDTRGGNASTRQLDGPRMYSVVNVE